jgi:putative aldouronate transport system permease protein
MKKTKFKKETFKRNLELLLLCLPVIITLFLFNYLPMGGVVLAFKNWKPLRGIWGSPWVGLRNFEFFVRSPLIWKVTRNTLLYNTSFIILMPIFSVAFAIMLYEAAGRRATKFYQTVFFLPFFLSWVAVSIMGYAFLSTETGLLNGVLSGWFGGPCACILDRGNGRLSGESLRSGHG